MINFQTLTHLPSKPGVYTFRDSSGQALYVGKAINLKDRVKSYFAKGLELGPRTVAMVKRIARIEHVVVESEIEALLLELDLIKRLKPKYNIQWKDDKAYKYIKISKVKVSTTRLVEDKNAKYFGPFPEGGTVNQVLRSLRRIFPFRDCSEAKFKRYRRLERPCLYGDLQLCSAPCVGRINSKDYRKIVKQLEEFMSGKSKRVIQELKKEMESYSKNNEFEKAAALRDRIRNFAYVTQSFRPAADYFEHPDLVEDRRQQELKALARIVANRSSIQRIEAYDISNISGQFAVGSMVVFVAGEPSKRDYRRFRIKEVKGISDVGMLREVLRRRLKKAQSAKVKTQRLAQKSKLDKREDNAFTQIPDLILIDGGKPQVSAVKKVLGELGLEIPVLGLAKGEEKIFNSELLILDLPKNSPALHLLQRVRDEAHRFALSYHQRIRSGSLRG